MSINVHIQMNSLGNITIYMKGNLNFENNLQLKIQLLKLIKENPLITITIDMHHLDFVGSSGIGSFLQTIKLINKDASVVKLCNVKSEFISVFKLHENAENLNNMIKRFDEEDDSFKIDS